jgi:hypothetical protein
MSNYLKLQNGLGNSAAYQVSSKPFLTSSLTVPALGNTPEEVAFGSVTRFVIVTNTLPGSVANVPLRFGFSANGVSGSAGSNYAVLSNGESFQAEFRVTNLYLLSDNSSECSASVCAGLTTINDTELPNNWSGSLGVG